jgi:drug/metabolite transporter (DMT)-like permease
MNDDDDGFHGIHLADACGRVMAPVKEGGSIQWFRGISKPVANMGTDETLATCCGAKSFPLAKDLQSSKPLGVSQFVHKRHHHMHSAHNSFRGPLFMLAATGSYVINDTMMKMATVGLPPYEVLFLRGVAALLWGIPLLLMLGYGKQAGLMFEKRVLTRNLLELVAILSYVVALANMPIADAVALGQVTPLLMLLGASILFRETIGGVRAALILLGFAGALMVAQPTMEGVSIYALLALSNAVFCAARDIAGRRVAGHIPGMIVAISAVIVVLVGAGVAHILSEEWVMPGPRHLTLLLAAGFFLIFGHFFIFMAYRIGPTGVVAPFYYSFTVWAIVSGVIFFGELPNALALFGIGLVMASGLAIVLMDERRRRLTVIA